MTLQIQRSSFSGLAGAMDDLKAHQLWPTTYSTGQATAAEPHWHSEDVHGYVVEGDFNILDGEGQRYDLVPGDKFTVPARTLHAEGEINSPVTLIIGVSEPLTADLFLLPRDPSAL
jgi:mannose-6-phosphate isomerase-like protein (cupin superfamily)